MAKYQIRVFDDLYYITNKHIEKSVTLAVLLSNSNINDELVLKLPKQFKKHVTKRLMSNIFNLICPPELQDISKNNNNTKNYHRKIEDYEPEEDEPAPKKTAIKKNTKVDAKSIVQLKQIITTEFVLNYVNDYDVIIAILGMMRCNGLVDNFKLIFHDILKQFNISNENKQYESMMVDTLSVNPNLLNQFKFEITFDNFTQLIQTNVIKYDSSTDTFFHFFDKMNIDNTIMNKWITIPFTHKIFMNKIINNKNATGLIIDMPTLIKQFNKYSYGIIDDVFAQFMIKEKNIYIAGGFLVGCMKDNVPDWSDIDIWVHGESDDVILQKTIVLLNRLYHTLRLSGFTKILWSTHKNVITMYCAEYRRNIQVIMNDKTPRDAVAAFDIDVLRAFTDGSKLECTVGCLFSNRRNVITQITDHTNPNRIVKMMLKGYIVTPLCVKNLITNTKNNPTLEPDVKQDLIKNFNNISLLVDAFYSVYKKGKTSSNKIEELNNIINTVTNKYYYPSTSEVLSFMNGTDIEKVKSRATYIIKQICGHTIIDCDIASFIEKFKDNYNEPRAITVDNKSFFSVHYGDDIITDAIEGLNFIRDIDESNVININNLDPTRIRFDIIPFNDTNPINIFINPAYMLEDLNTCPIYVRTDFIKLEWYPLMKYKPAWFKSRNDIKLYNIRVYDITHTHIETVKLFDTISNLDAHLLNNKNVSLRQINDEDNDEDNEQEPYIFARSMYQPIIHSYEDAMEDSEEEDLPRKRNARKAIKRPIHHNKNYITFKHYNYTRDENSPDDYKINTPVYKNGELVPINSPSDLAEHVKVGAEIQIEFVLDMMLQKGAITARRRYPRLRITRLFVR